MSYTIKHFQIPYTMEQGQMNLDQLNKKELTERSEKLDILDKDILKLSIEIANGNQDEKILSGTISDIGTVTLRYLTKN